MEASHINTENEKVTVRELSGGHRFAGSYLLVIHDDPPPRGSGIEAPMLLDKGTIEWLSKMLSAIA